MLNIINLDIILGCVYNVFFSTGLMGIVTIGIEHFC